MPISCWADANRFLHTSCGTAQRCGVEGAQIGGDVRGCRRAYDRRRPDLRLVQFEELRQCCAVAGVRRTSVVDPSTDGLGIDVEKLGYAVFVEAGFCEGTTQYFVHWCAP